MKKVSKKLKIVRDMNNFEQNMIEAYQLEIDGVWTRSNQNLIVASEH